tara:strand:+ start:2664 stop:3329 length:666 start_codon:yes stop_codon:yes gene_type:complete
MIEDFVVLIPLRGGSKGLSKKNLRLFNGKPLFTWCTNAALNANLKVIISTECQDIKDSVQKFCPKAIIQDRPLSLATDTSSTEDVIKFFIQEYNYNNIILLQATSPLTLTSDIKLAIEYYKKCLYRPLVSGIRKHIFAWGDEGYSLNYDPMNRPRRQDWKGCFVENGAIYIFQRNDFELFNSRCPEPCTLFEMTKYTSVEIDSEEDLIYLESLNKRFNILP